MSGERKRGGNNRKASHDGGKDSKRPPLIPLMAYARRQVERKEENILQETSNVHNNAHIPEENDLALRETPIMRTVFFSESEYDDCPQFLDMDDENQFDLMNVTVVVYGLSGILCEKEESKSKKKKRSKFGSLKKENSATRNTNDSVSKLTSSVFGSSAGSLSSSIPSNEELDNPNDAPTTAVVSFRKNAFSSQTSLETFIPSMPLSLPSSTAGGKSRYAASWPSEQSSLVKQDDCIERSSFKLIRCMQQESFVPGKPSKDSVSNYVHETVELRINLSRGTELVPLGMASLVISGDEEGEVQMHIPAKPISTIQKEKKKKLTPKRFKSKTKSKTNKNGYFSSDPSRRFYLDENAAIRVGVQVIPQNTIKIAEEREKQDLDLKALLEKIGDENLERRGGNNENTNIKRFSQNNFSLSNLRTAIPSPKVYMPQTPPQEQGTFQGFLCGAMMCNPTAAPAPEPVEPGVPLEIVHTKNELRYQYGVASLMSSVSESTDGSDDESDLDIERHVKEFREAQTRRNLVPI